MSTHNVTTSAPIVRRLFDIATTVIVLRCQTCPAWRREVYEVDVAATRRIHVRSGK